MEIQGMGAANAKGPSRIMNGQRPQGQESSRKGSGSR